VAHIDGDQAEKRLTFGKYRGQQLGDVPESYLRWCLDQEWFEKQYPDMVDPFESELRFRDKWK